MPPVSFVTSCVSRLVTRINFRVSVKEFRDVITAGR